MSLRMGVADLIERMRGDRVFALKNTITFLLSFTAFILFCVEVCYSFPVSNIILCRATRRPEPSGCDYGMPGSSCKSSI